CDDFRLDLLSQHIAAVDRGERAILGVRAGVQCLVREVSLNCGRRPVVFAHSVVESRALRGPWRMLMTLGARPLGAALFADPRVERTKDRPLAAKLISPHEAMVVAAVLVALAFALVVQLNLLTIKLSLVALALAVVYPFLKRVFWLPQAWLGIAFGFGIPMA